MDAPHGLDDPEYAAFAWARYRRILGWMAMVAAAAGLRALAGIGNPPAGEIDPTRELERTAFA